MFVLVHSPLVGPGTCQPAARELGRRGRYAIVPDLTSTVAAPPPHWRAAVDAVVSAIGTAHDVVLVAHSAAGALLLAIGVRTAAVAYLFVDAVLPPERA